MINAVEIAAGVNYRIVIDERANAFHDYKASDEAEPKKHVFSCSKLNLVLRAYFPHLSFLPEPDACGPPL